MRRALQDYPQWRRLWQAYLAFYHTNVTDAVYKTTFARLTSADQPQQNAWAAEISGTLQGLVRSLVDLMDVDIRVPDFSTLFVPRVRADIADEIAC